MVQLCNALARRESSPNSAIATMGNSKPLLACTVMMRTESPSPADSAPGASRAASTSAAKRAATPAGPSPLAASKSAAWRITLYTLPARARPSAPAASRRASQPESTTIPCMTSDSGTRPTCSDARFINAAAQASAGEGALPDAVMRSKLRKPSSNRRRFKMPRFASVPVDSSIKSSAESANSSLDATSNSAFDPFGFASASARRTMRATSGARLKMDPPATTQGSPAARMAAAYVSAFDMAPSSTTISPGACPARRYAAKRCAMRDAWTRRASSVATPRYGKLVTCTLTRGPGPAKGRFTRASSRPACKDM